MKLIRLLKEAIGPQLFLKVPFLGDFLIFFENNKVRKFRKVIRMFIGMFRGRMIVRYAVRVTRPETRLTVYWAFQ